MYISLTSRLMCTREDGSIIQGLLPWLVPHVRLVSISFPITEAVVQLMGAELSYPNYPSIHLQKLIRI